MQKRGFSLMEMMVVMLIVAIIAAATAPMINKKMIQNAPGDSPWIWTSALGNSIAFNINGVANSPAVIGAVKSPTSTMFHIKSPDKTTPQMTVMDDSNNTLRFGYLNNSVILSTKENANISRSIAIGEGAICTTDSVAIGADAGAQYESSIAIGDSASVSGDNSIAIGASAQGPENSIIIGTGVTTENKHTVAIGVETEKDYKDKVQKTKASSRGAMAFGVGANATGERSVAIGTYAQKTNVFGNNPISLFTNATKKGSVAIGVGVRASAEGSVAIGGNYDSK